MRALLVLVHRYVGLVLAGFLLVAGLTGSLLAWNDALEAVLAPQLFRATAVPGRQPLDPWCCATRWPRTIRRPGYASAG